MTGQMTTKREIWRYLGLDLCCFWIFSAIPKIFFREQDDQSRLVNIFAHVLLKIIIFKEWSIWRPSGAEVVLFLCYNSSLKLMVSHCYFHLIIVSTFKDAVLMRNSLMIREIELLHSLFNNLQNFSRDHLEFWLSNIMYFINKWKN